MLRLRSEIDWVCCALCGGRLVAERAAWLVAVDREYRHQRPAEVRCRDCDTMNVVELVDRTTVGARELRRIEEVAMS